MKYQIDLTTDEYKYISDNAKSLGLKDPLSWINVLILKDRLNSLSTVAEPPAEVPSNGRNRTLSKKLAINIYRQYTDLYQKSLSSDLIKQTGRSDILFLNSAKAVFANRSIKELYHDCVNVTRWQVGLSGKEHIVNDIYPRDFNTEWYWWDGLDCVIASNPSFTVRRGLQIIWEYFYNFAPRPVGGKGSVESALPVQRWSYRTSFSHLVHHINGDENDASRIQMGLVRKYDIKALLALFGVVYQRLNADLALTIKDLPPQVFLTEGGSNVLLGPQHLVVDSSTGRPILWRK